jgi:hypothetical protein
VKEGCWGLRQWVTTPRGGAWDLSCNAPQQLRAQADSSLAVAPPLLRVTVLCVTVVVGEAVWKDDWGVLYVGHA